MLSSTQSLLFRGCWGGIRVAAAVLHITAYCRGLGHPQPPTGGFGPFGPEVSRGVSQGVSPKIGVSERVSWGVSRGPFGPRAQECPKGVPRVSPECQKGVRTLRRHSRDTFWTLWGPGPEGPLRHSPGHSLGHPDFWDTPSDTPRHTSGPKGPKPPVGGWGCLKPWLCSLRQQHSGSNERCQLGLGAAVRGSNTPRPVDAIAQLKARPWGQRL